MFVLLTILIGTIIFITGIVLMKFIEPIEIGIIISVIGALPYVFISIVWFIFNNISKK